MEEDEKKVMTEQQPAEQQPAQPEDQSTEQPVSARDRYRSRYAEEYPDLNLDDDEALYGQANANLDELKKFRNSNKELSDALDKAPVLAGMVLAAKAGQNPFVYLAENIGPDMDIRDLAENPEFATQMGEALKKFQEHQDKMLAKEKMIEDFIGDYDDAGEPVEKASFLQRIRDGIITRGMWETLFNARHYADDIKSAEEKARATALNEKIQNKVKTFDSGVPTLTGGARGVGEQPKPKPGGFKSWGEDL